MKWIAASNQALTNAIRETRRYWDNASRISAQAHQQRMRSIAARGAAAPSAGKTYSDILDISHQGYLNRDSINDKGHGALVSRLSTGGGLLRFGLGSGLLMAALFTPAARAESEGSAEGLLELEITSPASLPPGFTLNPGGTIPSNFAFPDPGNSGAGSLTALGSAGCTPVGCTDPAPGLDIEYQLSTDLTCVSNPDGTYGGLEDSFALFGASNSTGGSVTLGLRFTSSWSVAATALDPPDDSANASIDLLWAVPTDFCIELSSCPTGSLSGGTTAGCPAGFTTATTLILGTSEVDTDIGDASDMGPVSICDATVVVLPGASSGGDLSVTASCEALGCAVLTLSDETVDGEVTEESCRILAGSNYYVTGPNGKLTLRATRYVELGDGFSVGLDGELTVKIDSE